MTSTDSNDALALNGPVLDAHQPITASPSSTLLNPPDADIEPESTTANAITRLDDDDGDESEDDDDEEEEENEDGDGDDDDDASVKAPVPSAEERAKELERIVSQEMDGYKHPSSASEEEDEEDEEDSEEDSEEEDDEEDEEPLFKYKRLEGSVPTVLSRRESASAITVANKRLVCLCSCHGHDTLTLTPFCRPWEHTRVSYMSWTSQGPSSSRSNPTRPLLWTSAWIPPVTLSPLPLWTVNLLSVLLLHDLSLMKQPRTGRHPLRLHRRVLRLRHETAHAYRRSRAGLCSA
jgi:hypothetical protein